MTDNMMCDKEQNLIRELVKALDLDELTDGYRRRLQILDSQIEAFNGLGVEYRERLDELSNIIDNFRAICTVCGRLNILIGNRKPNNKQGPEDDRATIEKLADWY